MIQHDVGILRKLLGGAKLLDDPLSGEQSGIGELEVLIVHSD